MEIQIINADHKGIGEIALKSESIFKGYLDDAKETEEHIKEGWFYTGDLGKIDEDGYLFICGRNKNVIVLPNGKKIFPEEIEAMLNNIPGIIESEVYAREQYNNDTKINATVVLEKEITDEIRNKINSINEILPQYKKITDIKYTNIPLDKTSTGKIKRTHKMLAENNSKNGELQSNNAIAIINEIVSKQLGVNEINKEMDIVRDLGADSLDEAEIFLSIEKNYNIKLTKQNKENVTKVGDLYNLVTYIDSKSLL